jgi:hypothetical protein
MSNCDSAQARGFCASLNTPEQAKFADADEIEPLPVQVTKSGSQLFRRPEVQEFHQDGLSDKAAMTSAHRPESGGVQLRASDLGKAILRAKDRRCLHTYNREHDLEKAVESFCCQLRFR